MRSTDETHVAAFLNEVVEADVPVQLPTSAGILGSQLQMLLLTVTRLD